MGIFSKNGTTTNLKSTTSSGIVGGVIRSEMSNDILVEKYMGGDDIKRGAVIVTHQNQLAALYANGVRQEMLEPGREVVVDSNNLPFLGKLLNIATGGESSYKVEVWFLNITTECNIKIGFGKNENVRCRFKSGFEENPLNFFLAGNGNVSIKLCNPEIFLDKIVGKEKLKSADDIAKFLKEKINNTFVDLINELIKEQDPDIEDLLRTSRKKFSSQFIIALNRELQDEYGIEVTSNTSVKFTSQDYQDYTDAANEGIREGTREGSSVFARRSRMKQYDGSEQYYDIMKTVASNEGSGNTSAMGLGFEIGSQLRQFAQSYKPETQQMQNPASVPPPIPTSVSFFFVINGQQAGPYDMVTVQQYITSGIITADTLAWKTGMSSWTICRCVPELSSLFQTPPPPPTNIPPIPSV